jgi:hypothetical protein
MPRQAQGRIVTLSFQARARQYFAHTKIGAVSIKMLLVILFLASMHKVVVRHRELCAAS